MTAREALITILQENNMTRKDGKNLNNANARVVIYFPEGEYVLHNDDDNTIEPASRYWERKVMKHILWIVKEIIKVPVSIYSQAIL